MFKIASKIKVSSTVLLVWSVELGSNSSNKIIFVNNVKINSRKLMVNVLSIMTMYLLNPKKKCLIPPSKLIPSYQFHLRCFLHPARIPLQRVYKSKLPSIVMIMI